MHSRPKNVVLSSLIEESLVGFNDKSSFEEIGKVISVCDGVIKIYGLEKVGMNEVVELENGARGMILNIESETVSAVLFDTDKTAEQGHKVKRTKTVVSTMVGKGMSGRVVDAMGRPIDNKGKLDCGEYRPIEVKAPGISERKSIHEPLQTGIKIIDALFPIGKGQRELIIGDRKTGKTSIAIDTIINQAKINETLPQNERTYSIYVAIGQKMSTITRIMKYLENHDAMKYTTIVVASASDVAAMQFLAPYTGCSIAEYFRDNGMHSLIIYDDLSKHAVAYRQISLLLRRPPGREAYPGDIFYIHSRLLERAAKMSDECGGGSLTALPIIETQSGDLSAYVPTNVISITDGQIFLDTELFNKGFRPAVNVGLSVSRIGSAAQTKIMKQVSGRIKLDLAQFRELEAFAKFSCDLDDQTKKVLNKGHKLTKILIQDVFKPLSVLEQISIIYTCSNNYLDDVEDKNIDLFQKKMFELVNKNQELIEMINSKKEINDEVEILLTSIINQTKNEITQEN